MNRRDSLKSILLACLSSLLGCNPIEIEKNWYRFVELPTPTRHYVAADCAWMACCDPNLPNLGDTPTGETWDIHKPFAIRYKVSAVTNSMWLVEVFYKQAVKVNT